MSTTTPRDDKDLTPAQRQAQESEARNQARDEQHRQRGEEKDSHDRRLHGKDRDAPVTEREAILKVDRESHEYQNLSPEERSKRDRDSREAVEPDPIEFDTLDDRLTKAGIGHTPPIEMADGVQFNIIVGGELFGVKVPLDALYSEDTLARYLVELRGTYGIVAPTP